MVKKKIQAKGSDDPDYRLAQSNSDIFTCIRGSTYTTKTLGSLQ